MKYKYIGGLNSWSQLLPAVPDAIPPWDQLHAIDITNWPVFLSNIAQPWSCQRQCDLSSSIVISITATWTCKNRLDVVIVMHPLYHLWPKICPFIVATIQHLHVVNINWEAFMEQVGYELQDHPIMVDVLVNDYTVFHNWRFGPIRIKVGLHTEINLQNPFLKTTISGYDSAFIAKYLLS